MRSNVKRTLITHIACWQIETKEEHRLNVNGIELESMTQRSSEYLKNGKVTDTEEARVSGRPSALRTCVGCQVSI